MDPKKNTALQEEEALAVFDRYNRKPHRFSLSFRWRLHRCIRAAEVKDASTRGGRRRMMRILVPFTALLLLTGAVLAVAGPPWIAPKPPVVEKEVIQQNDGSVNISFSEVNPTGKPIARVPEYIPEGFVVERAYGGGADPVFTIVYKHKITEAYLMFSRSDLGAGESFYDIKHHDIEDVLVKGLYTGLYSHGRDGRNDLLAWVQDGYEYWISGAISFDEFFNIAESIK